jgi:pimeloyl-ACP methyl ester carboxylesterase
MSAPCSGWVKGAPQLHYLQWDRPGPDTLVLIHGNSANAWWWRPVADELSDFSGQIVALDLRGHGDSEWVRPPAYRPETYAEDIGRLLDHLGLERPAMAGHSAGGVATLAFAARFPDRVRALATIDIPVRSTPRRDRYLRHLKSLPMVTYPDLETAKRKFRLMPDEGKIASDLLNEIAGRSLVPSSGGGYTMKFDRESFFGSDGLDVVAAIRGMRVPLLIIRAGESRILAAEAAAEAVQLNPLVKLVTIAGAHHHLPLERPAELAATVRTFIACNPAIVADRGASRIQS